MIKLPGRSWVPVESLTTLDLITAAAQRYPVAIRRNDRTLIATLIAVRPNRTRARVRFLTGNEATVPYADLSAVSAPTLQESS